MEITGSWILEDLITGSWILEDLITGSWILADLLWYTVGPKHGTGVGTRC